MGLSTTYTKTETDFLIQQLEKKTASVYKGDLRKSDPAPTQIGFYGLLETGVYPNLGNIDAQAGKLNFASFDGTTWSLIAVDISLESLSKTEQLKNALLANYAQEYESSIIKSLDGGNYYIDSSGNNQAHPGCVVSELIDVTGFKYVIPYLKIWDEGYCVFLDASNNIVSRIQVTDDNLGDIVKIPSNAKYFKASAFINSQGFPNPVIILLGKIKDIKEKSLEISSPNTIEYRKTFASRQRWGDVTGGYLKIKFPSTISSSYDSYGIQYFFDLTLNQISRTVISTTTAPLNNELKLRVGILRYKQELFIPSIEYVSGNVSLIDDITFNYEMDATNSLIIPSIIIKNSNILFGAYCDNLHIEAADSINQVKFEDIANFEITEISDISGVTFIKSFLDNIVNKNINIPPQIIRKPFTFSGKTAEFCGDSITKGFTTGNTTTANGYPKLFSDLVGLTYTNSGISGALFTNGSIVKQVEDASKTVDYLFIAGGTNDWQHDVPYSDFKTVIDNLCSYINANFPSTTKVIWITPINNGGRPFYNPIRSLNMYRKIITESVLKNDTYSRFSVIHGANFGFPDEYSTNTDLKNALYGDLLHPTELGYKLYSSKLAENLL